MDMMEEVDVGDEVLWVSVANMEVVVEVGLCGADLARRIDLTKRHHSH
jgi:hypothetical protein